MPHISHFDLVTYHHILYIRPSCPWKHCINNMTHLIRRMQLDRQPSSSLETKIFWIPSQMYREVLHLDCTKQLKELFIPLLSFLIPQFLFPRPAFQLWWLGASVSQPDLQLMYALHISEAIESVLPLFQGPSTMSFCFVGQKESCS